MISKTLQIKVKIQSSGKKLLPALICFPPGENLEFQTCMDSKYDSFADLNQLVIDGISFFIGISSLVAVILLVYAGYMYIMSAGDSEKVSKATKIITNTIIGLIIIWISGLIIRFVLDTILQ